MPSEALDSWSECRVPQSAGSNRDDHLVHQLQQQRVQRPSG